MTPGAQLQHAGQELGRFLVPKVAHLVKLLDVLEVSQLVRSQQPSLKLGVGSSIRGVLQHVQH
jgi:hypothetical protein